MTGTSISTDIHFQALCNAIENEKIDKCRSILQATSASGKVDLSSTNNDGFTPLDLAFMTGQPDLVELILDHGGVEGRTFPSSDRISSHLHALIHESRKQVEKFGHLIKAAHGTSSKSNHISNVPTNLTQSQLKECEKQQTLWQKRMATLRRLKQGFDTAGCPHAPVSVTVEVLGQRTLSVGLKSPDSVGGRSLFTKCRIQWSHTDTFVKLEGELITTDGVGRNPKVLVRNLVEGQRYFVRASFGNPKGFGPFSAASPKSVVPSSWRGLDDRPVRLQDQKEACLEAYRTAFGLEPDLEPQKLVPKKKGLRNLFSTSSSTKFHRSLHANRLYLACVLFHEDKVLMTNEEVLPIVEICDEVPQGIVTDYLYLAKVCTCSKDVERLKAELSKSQSSNSVANHRYKIIQAVLSMQHALGITDLGTIFHRPFKNSDGSVVFSVTSHVKNPKQLVTLSLKWVPLSKAQRPHSFDGQPNSMDALRLSLREQILFKQVSEISLSPGLYLCYLQCESTIDQMKLIVSTTSPSILPYVKLRNNSHVTSEEWSWIQQMAKVASKRRSDSSMQAPSPTTNFLAGEGEEGSDVFHDESLKPTEIQYLFGQLLLQGSNRLLDHLKIGRGSRGQHRLYDQEIIEMTPDISIIFLLPSPEHVCAVADNRPPLDTRQNDLLPINLALFEFINLATYHPDVAEAFYRVALLLEVTVNVAKQNHREAFSNQELQDTQNALSKLMEQQQLVEECWKPMRWMLEVISTARTKSQPCGLACEDLHQWYQGQTEAPDDSHLNYDQLGMTVKDSSSNHVDYRQRSQVTRTPTTRSDPLEFKVSSNNDKENEVHNFPRSNLGYPQISPGQSGTFSNSKKTSSYSSLTFSSQHSTNSSLSSNQDMPAQYENSHVANKGHTYDPRVAQGGRFSNIPQKSSTPSGDSNRYQHSPEPNVLQVFAAYDTGLASGTSVKLNVNNDTTAREVIDLVIKQLNMAVILKGKEGPIYDNDCLKNFCLVACIGSRERCLRDDFKPLNLQNPWKRGKLFVRMKNDLLAAIEHISRHSTML